MTHSSQNSTRDMILCALFAAMIAIGAFIKVPVPVVPFTLQFLFTNLAGLILGKRLGAAACLLYIAAGLMGAPVFASGGGPAYVFNPTFGYLIGFAAGAWAAGTVAEFSALPSGRRMLLAGFANILVVYAFGLSYYYIAANLFTSSPIGLWPLFLYGFILAVPGDIALCFASAALAYRLQIRVRGAAA